MSRRPTVNPGRLIWAGEHWINAIRPADTDQPSAWFSLYHTRYSEAGEGNALQLVIRDSDVRAFLTDDRIMAGWTKDQLFSISSVRTSDAPIIEATFTRSGATHTDPAWVVEWEGHRVIRVVINSRA